MSDEAKKEPENKPPIDPMVVPASVQGRVAQALGQIPKVQGSDGRTPASMKAIIAREQRESPTIAQTREWIQAGVVTGAASVYQQIMDSNAQMFQQMEETVYSRILQEIERQSLLGRFKAFLARRTKRHLTLNPASDAPAQKADSAARPLQMPPKG